MNSRKICGDSQEMRDMAARICRDYLNGPWKQINSQNIGFKHISGGLSNWLYHVWLPEHLQSKPVPTGTPKEVLIRVYGQMHGERALEALITESVVFTLLSERGLGPRLHGVFPGGRIEQYIAARPLRTAELREPRLSSLIARKMAAVHRMEVPLSKEPRWLWDTMQRWIQTCQKKLSNEDAIPKDALLLKSFDLPAELAWLKRTLAAHPSPVVFCHNDFQEGNILLEEKNAALDPKLVLIDFEYCSYNYRGFDIANHLLEWTYDYTETSPPYYRENPENYPTEQQRLSFAKNYLDEMGSPNTTQQQLLAEIRTYSLASHLFWGIWSLINAGSSQIPFGYWEYAVSRLTAYSKLKTEISASLPQKRKLDESP